MYDFTMREFMMDELAKCDLPKSIFNPKPGATYKQDHLRAALMGAASLDTSVGGYLNGKNKSRGLVYTRTGVKTKPVWPSGDWFELLVNAMSPSNVQEFFQNAIASQINTMKQMINIPPEGVDIAIDGHKIERYDKKHGDELRKSKSKNGTNLFEVYVTVHCVTRDSRLVLGALPMNALTNISSFVPKLLEICQKMDLPVNHVLMDREFFTAEVIRDLNAMGVKFLIPCKNTPTVVKKLREFYPERKSSSNRVEMEITPATGDSAPYTMIIVDRKNPKKKKGELSPEDKLIGFATNCPDADVEKYAKRWGIETAYRVIENMRAKTRSKQPGARIFCFLYSLLIYNIWILVKILLAATADTDAIFTQCTYKEILQNPPTPTKPT